MNHVRGVSNVGDQSVMRVRVDEWMSGRGSLGVTICACGKEKSKQQQ